MVSWPFDTFEPEQTFDVAEFGDLLDELHGFHRALASAAPARDDIRRLKTVLEQCRLRLEAAYTDVEHSPYGQLDDLPCHGLGHLPAWHATHESDTSLHARFSFSRWHIGGGGAAHGGMVTTVLDDVMGSCASEGGRSPARTAYLNTTFKALTPIDTELGISVTVTESVGRKRYVHGEIRHGRQICAEAEGLFISVDEFTPPLAAQPATASPTVGGAGESLLTDARNPDLHSDQAPPMARSCPSQ